MLFRKNFWYFNEKINFSYTITKAYNNGAAIIPGATNLQLGNGRFDALDGVNSPDISELPDTSTFYVTWESNTSDPTENVAKASTTGTIYDTAGGAWEYVMGFLALNGVLVNSTTIGTVGVDMEYNTWFTGTAQNGETIVGVRTLPDRKYYDVYTYGTLENDFRNGYIGEAICYKFF